MFVKRTGEETERTSKSKQENLKRRWIEATNDECTKLHSEFKIHLFVPTKIAGT